MQTDSSKITRVQYGKKETVSHVLDSDEYAAYQADDGSLTIELFRKNAKGRLVESYRFQLSPEDAAHTHRETATYLRRHREDHQ